MAAIRASARWTHDYLFGWVKEPRAVTYTTCVVYFVLAVFTGLGALLIPPASVSVRIGPHATAVWAGLVLLGGVLAIAGALPGWWWLERTGIIGLASGLFIYAVVVLTLHHEGAGNRLPQTGVIFAMIIVLLVRWLRVRGALSDPSGGYR